MTTISPNEFLRSYISICHSDTKKASLEIKLSEVQHCRGCGFPSCSFCFINTYYHLPFLITQAFTTTNPVPLVLRSIKPHLYSLLINFIFTVAYDHAEWSKPQSQTRVTASSVCPFLTRTCHIFILEFSCYSTRGPFLLARYKLTLEKAFVRDCQNHFGNTSTCNRIFL